MKKIKVGKLFFGFSFAKSWTWGIIDKNDIKNVTWFGIITKKRDDIVILKIVIIPILIQIGWFI